MKQRHLTLFQGALLAGTLSAQVPNATSLNLSAGEGGPPVSGNVLTPTPVLQLYTFDVAGNDGGSLNGWIDTIGSTKPSSTVFSDNGNNNGGRGAGAQDNAHPSAVMTSPAFQLQENLVISFQIAGGAGSANPPANLAAIPANSSDTGFHGVGLRRLSDDAYVLTARRNGNGNGFQNRGFTREELATVNAANPGETFVLDWIDSFSGGWGFAMIDNVKLTLGASVPGNVPLVSPPLLLAGQAGYDSTLEGTLNDGFAYNPITPTNPLPSQVFGANTGFHNASGNTPAILVYDLVTPLAIGSGNQLAVDLYGRDGFKDRDNDIDVAFLAADSTVLGELKGLAIPDTGAAWLRVSTNGVVPDGATVAKIRITGNDSAGDTAVTNDFTLLELRAANLQKAFTDVPPTVTAVNGDSAAVGQEITLPSGALLALNADGSFRYDANGAIEAVGAPAADSFEYSINFPGGVETTATVNIAVIDSDSPIYVDDDWATLADGASITDADAGTAGNQSATFGTNAFATLQEAVVAADPGVSIVVNAGTYDESIGMNAGRSIVIGGLDAAQAVSITALSTPAVSEVALLGTSTLALGKGSLEGSLRGSGSLVKNLEGVLTLAGETSLTGPVVLDGGTLALQGAANLGTGAVAVNRLSVLQTNSNVVLANDITGTMDLIKSGPGSVKFDGTISGYTGLLTAASGGIEIPAGSSIGGSVAINPGATLAGEGTISGDLVLGVEGATGARILPDPETTGTLVVNGSLTLHGVTALGGVTEVAVPTPFIRYGTTLDLGNAADLSSAFMNQAGGRRTVADTAKTLAVTISNPESIAFTSAQSDVWQVGGPDTNWSSSDSFFVDGDHVIFDDSVDAEFSGTVTVTGSPAPSSITFNNSVAQEYTLNGNPIRGATGLVKNSDGTVNLTTPQDFTGEVVINGGVLKQDNIIRNVSGVKVNPEGTFITSATNIFVSGHGQLVPDSVVIAVDGGTWIADEQHDARVGNVNLANGATWRSDRPLTLYDLLIANTTAGPATVKVTGTGASMMASDGVNGLHLQGLPVFDVEDTTSSPQADLLVSMVLDGSGATGGAGGFRKQGPGTMFLSAANTYDDIAYVDEGILSIEDYTVIPNSDYSKVHVAAGAGFGGIVGFANLTDADLETIAENVVWAANGTSRLVLDTNGETVEVGIDFAGRGFQIYAQGGGTLNLTGNATGVVIANDGATTVNSDSPAPIQVGVSSIVTGVGTEPGTLKTSIAFTTDGSVDVYASDDLATWGAPIASGLGAAASPFIEDNIAAGGAKRFYVIVGAGSPPPTP